MDGQEPRNDPPTKRLGGSIIHQDRFVTYRLDDVQFENGVIGKYSVIGPTEGFGVVAIPMILHRGISYLGLVKQYRYPIGKYSLELPRGGATSLSADEAGRELLEETDMNPGPAELLGIIRPDTGMLSTEVAVFLFRQNPEDKDIVFREEESGATTHWHSYGAILGMIRTGEITCGITLAAISLLVSSGQIRDY